MSFETIVVRPMTRRIGAEITGIDLAPPITPPQRAELLEAMMRHHVYRSMTADPAKRFPCNSPPIVRTHPVSGRKCLYVNSSYVTHIDGVAKPESDAILHFLYVHCMDPNFQVRFRWQANSIAFWDNRCTQHQAIWDYFPDLRSGYRVTIAGDKPY